MIAAVRLYLSWLASVAAGVADGMSAVWEALAQRSEAMSLTLDPYVPGDYTLAATLIERADKNPRQP